MVRRGSRSSQSTMPTRTLKPLSGMQAGCSVSCFRIPALLGIAMPAGFQRRFREPPQSFGTSSWPFSHSTLPYETETKPHDLTGGQRQKTLKREPVWMEYGEAPCQALWFSPQDSADIGTHPSESVHLGIALLPMGVTPAFS